MTDPDPESPDWQRVKEIFAEAGELPVPPRAPRYVHRAAAGDPVLEREVLRLLRLDEGAEEWLDGLRPPTEVVQAAADLHAFFPGQVLAARYEIQQFLAVGGMGEVYSAHDLQLDQRIAIKVIAGELATADQVSLLKREVQAARRIQHANVCRVFDLVQTEVARGRSAVFLTMELLEGETLSQKLHREGALTERQAMPLIRQMVAALSAAHQAGVIHGDFKSSNVMIVPREGGSARAVVTDFGLARRLAPGRGQTLLSLSKGSLAGYGTPAYMSPEQIQGGKASQAADVYALGVVLYEMLTGELPYGEDSPLAMAVKKSREPPVAPESLSPGAAAHLVRRDPEVHGGRTRAALSGCAGGAHASGDAHAQRAVVEADPAAASPVAAHCRGRGGCGGRPAAGPLAVAGRARRRSRGGLAAGRVRSAGWRTGRGGAPAGTGHRPASPPAGGARVSRVGVARIGIQRQGRSGVVRLAAQTAATRSGSPIRRGRRGRIAWTAGAGARDPGATEACWPIWRSSTINWAGPRRRTNGSRLRPSFRIIRPRTCGWRRRRRSRANGSRPSGNSFWRRPTSVRLATPIWCAPCRPAAASRAWKAEIWIRPAPTCLRSSACNRACRIPAMGLASEPSR